MEAKNAREKLRRRPLVVGRDDCVVEGDGHRPSLLTAAEYRSRRTIDRSYGL
jgi:hypothetical protein